MNMFSIYKFETDSTGKQGYWLYGQLLVLYFDNIPVVQ